MLKLDELQKPASELHFWLIVIFNIFSLPIFGKSIDSFIVVMGHRTAFHT